MPATTPPFRIARFEDGVLEMRVRDLRDQIADLRKDVTGAMSLSDLRMVRLGMIDMDRGWSEMRSLLSRVLKLPAPALEIENAMVILWSTAVTSDGRGDYVARALGTLVRPAHLESFALRGSLLTNEGVERLQEFLTGIAHLDLTENDLGDAALSRIARWPGTAPSLRSLRFDQNKLTARGITALAEAELPELATLSLRNCNLGGACVRRLLAGSLPNVTELSLGANPLGDDGAEAIAESEGAGRFERLELAACGITDAGARRLANAPQLRSIGGLDLRGNRYGDLGRKMLHDRFGERVRTGPMRPGH